MTESPESDIRAGTVRNPFAGAIPVLLLAAIVPAFADAVLTSAKVAQHLGYYIDAVMIGTLVTASAGFLIGVLGLGVLRLVTRRMATREEVAACCFGVASAIVVALALPRVIGFDRPLVHWAVVILPFVAFVICGVLRFLACRRDNATIVVPAVAPAVAYVAWVILASPSLAASRNARLLSIGWLALLYVVTAAATLWLERRAAPRPIRSRSLAAVVSVAVGLMAAAWWNVREPLFTPVRGGEASSSPDVLLIVLDTARSDMFAIGDPEIDLPALRRFASESHVYSSAFASSCWTLPTHGSMFTGLPASLNGTLTGPLSPSVSTLAQRFRRAGYGTAMFSGNPLLGSSSKLNRGFQHFENFLPGEQLRDRAHVWLNAVVTSRTEVTRPLWHLRDDGGAIMVSRVLRYLDETPGPKFVFLNLFEPHDPYAPPFVPDEWATRNGFTPRELRTIKGEPYAELTDWSPPVGSDRYFAAMRLLYKGELAYVDFLLGQLFDRLEHAGRLDRTAIIIVSDHGENIGEHFPSLTHTLGLFDTLIHVPFMIRYPPKVPPTRDDRLISTERVHDMLLDLAGVEGVRVGSPQSSVNEVVFSEWVPGPGLIAMIESMAGRELPEYRRTLRAVRTRDRKWIESSDLRHEAYDLRTDPLEQNNLMSEPGTVPSGFEELAAMLEGRPELSYGERIPAELEKSLRALGYNQ